LVLAVVKFSDLHIFLSFICVQLKVKPGVCLSSELLLQEEAFRRLSGAMHLFRSFLFWPFGGTQIVWFLKQYLQRNPKDLRTTEIPRQLSPRRRKRLKMAKRKRKKDESTKNEESDGHSVEKVKE
jgi:hypothetical protein